MRKVIKKECVRIDGSGAAQAGRSARSTDRVPGVRLIRLDGRVHSIELTCRCGDVSILEIEYDGAEAQPEVTS